MCKNDIFNKTALQFYDRTLIIDAHQCQNLHWCMLQRM